MCTTVNIRVVMVLRVIGVIRVIRLIRVINVVWFHVSNLVFDIKYAV